MPASAFEVQLHATATALLEACHVGDNPTAQEALNVISRMLALVGASHAVARVAANTSPDRRASNGAAACRDPKSAALTEHQQVQQQLQAVEKTQEELRLLAINISDPLGGTPLLYAAKNNMPVVVQQLLMGGADVSRCMAMSNNSALHLASKAGHMEVVKVLVHALTTQNLEVDQRNVNLDTPLMFAAGAGHLGVANTLIKAGAEIRAQNKLGVSPLLAACSNGHELVLKLLVRLARQGDGPDVLEQRDASGSGPLHFACRKGHAQCVQLLLDSGCCANERNSGGRTPLVEARLSKDQRSIELVEEWYKLNGEVPDLLLLELGEPGYRLGQAYSSNGSNGKSNGSAGVQKRKKQRRRSSRRGSGTLARSRLSQSRDSSTLLEEDEEDEENGSLSYRLGGNSQASAITNDSPSETPYMSARQSLVESAFPSLSGDSNEGEGVLARGSSGGMAQSPANVPPEWIEVSRRSRGSAGKGALASTSAAKREVAVAAASGAAASGGGAGGGKGKGKGGGSSIWNPSALAKKLQAITQRTYRGSSSSQVPAVEVKDMELLRSNSATAYKPEGVFGPASQQAQAHRLTAAVQANNSNGGGRAASAERAVAVQQLGTDTETEGDEEFEGGWSSAAFQKLQEDFPTAAMLDVSPDHVLGMGMDSMSMSQLESLESIHSAALVKIAEAKLKLVRMQERERAVEELRRQDELKK